jgi:hypothetical protein
MSNEKSKATGHSSVAAKAEQASAHSKGVIPYERINIRMVQNVVLIWLDNNIDGDNDDDCRNTVIQLRRIIHNIKTYTDAHQFVEFLASIGQEKAFMIISESLGQHIVPFGQRMAED